MSRWWNATCTREKGYPRWTDLIIRTGNDYRTSNFLPWLASGYEFGSLFLRPLLAVVPED